MIEECFEFSVLAAQSIYTKRQKSLRILVFKPTRKTLPVVANGYSPNID
jgi:hypothetical protein